MEMNRNIVLVVALALLLTGVSIAFNVQPVKAVELTRTIFIVADGSVDPPTAPIQRNGDLYMLIDDIVINSPSDGIVIVRSNITLDGVGHTLQRVGPSEYSYPYGITSPSGGGQENVTIRNIKIRGFYGGVLLHASNGSSVVGNDIENVGYGPGVYTDFSSGCTIIGNKIARASMGIAVQYSDNNLISGNSITDSPYGFGFYRTSNNVLRSNSMTNTTYMNFDFLPAGVNNDVDASNTVDGKPIYYWVNRRDATVPTDAGDVILVYCKNITVQNLNLTSKGSAIQLHNTTDSSIIKNDITNSYSGIYFEYSSNNLIYHNNFINIGTILAMVAGSNVWDNGYPSGGNYWSDYTGVDLKSGSNQDQPGSDGIGDTSHIRSLVDCTDRYPLMSPFKTFDAGTWNGVAYSVDVVSNSTVSDFNFNPSEGPFIRFNMTGSSGTTGFSRVTIPKHLLWVQAPDQWTVMVDGVEVTPIVTEDANYTYLYFIYTHSTKTVQITGTNAVPEFPSAIILPLLMALTTLAIIFSKRRIYRKLDN